MRSVEDAHTLATSREGQARAKYNFTGQTDIELSFRKVCVVFRSGGGGGSISSSSNSSSSSRSSNGCNALWWRKHLLSWISEYTNVSKYLRRCHHDHGHCDSSSASFIKRRRIAGWPPTLKSSRLAWAVSQPVGCYQTTIVPISYGIL